MKVGDFIEVYHHLPRYEAGDIPLGSMGTGIIVDIEKRDREYPETAPDTLVSYLTKDGYVLSQWIDKELSGVVVTIKVLQSDECK